MKGNTIVLVSRWTGSMGEGLAVGLEAINNSAITGTKMARLAGGVESFEILNQDYSYSISVEKIYTVNNIPREQYIPAYFSEQQSSIEDLELKKALNLLTSKNN